VFKKNIESNFASTKIIEHMITDDQKNLLTERELQILRLIAEGRTTPLIASEMNLSQETIKWYRKRIMRKFSASTSAEVVRKAIREEII